MKNTNKYIIAIVILLISILLTELLSLGKEFIPYWKYIDPIGSFPALGPLFTALIFIIFSKRDRLSDFSFNKFNPKPLFIAILVFALAIAINLIIQYIFKFSIFKESINGIWLWQKNFNFYFGIFLYAIIYFAHAGFGEELCWRGFLYKKLIGLSWFKLIIIVNLIWVMWHLPGYIRYSNVINFLLFTILGFEIGIILQYLRVKTDSVIPAMIFHTVYNTFFIITYKTMKFEVEYLSGSPNIILIILLFPISFYYYKTGQIIYNEKIKSVANSLYN